VSGSHIAQRAVSQDVGITARGQIFCYFRGVARVKKLWQEIYEMLKQELFKE